MTDTSDKAIEALAAAPWAYASADLSAMILALQAERNQIAAEADARVKAAVLAEREAAVILVYEIIYENRHVTLGDKLVGAIRARGVTG